MTTVINGSTKLFGIIGNPVSHSLSPSMHNRAFSVLGENSVYLPFHVENIEAAVGGLRALGVEGASVTIPHKEAVLSCLDMVDPIAAKIGAVNTLHFVEEESQKLLCGSNTDWLGANRALESVMSLKDAHAVLLGAGGSARAIGFGLQEAGATVTLCSRTEARGRALAQDLGCQWVSLQEATTLEGDALVNATSVGMKEEVSPVEEEVVTQFSVVMDIVYAPLKTTLLQMAEKCGCKTVNGLEMLLYQGVAQFELWTGRSAPVEEMRLELLRKTGNR